MVSAHSTPSRHEPMAADRQGRQVDRRARRSRARRRAYGAARFASARAPGDGLGRPRSTTVSSMRALRRGGIGAHGDGKRSSKRRTSENGRRRAPVSSMRRREALARLRLRAGGQPQRRQQRELGLRRDDRVLARDVPPFGGNAGGVGESVDLARVGRARAWTAAPAPRLPRGSASRARRCARGRRSGRTSVGDRVVACIDERRARPCPRAARAGAARPLARRG